MTRSFVLPAQPEIMKKKTSKRTKEPSIEDSIEELSKISQKINSGEIPIEKTVEMYAEAMRLYKKSKEKLDTMKAKIREISEEEIFIDDKENQ